MNTELLSKLLDEVTSLVADKLEMRVREMVSEYVHDEIPVNDIEDHDYRLDELESGVTDLDSRIDDLESTDRRFEKKVAELVRKEVLAVLKDVRLIVEEPTPDVPVIAPLVKPE